MQSCDPDIVGNPQTDSKAGCADVENDDDDHLDDENAKALITSGTVPALTISARTDFGFCVFFLEKKIGLH